MKTVIAIVVGGLLAATLAIGQENEAQSSCCMMNKEQLTKMHQHMQQMQNTMQAIQNETDPAKRQALMQQHMAAMREGMGMMGMGKGGMMRKGGPGKGMQDMNMEQRIQRMENHMQMMQMMMEQMMEHESVVEDTAKKSG